MAAKGYWREISAVVVLKTFGIVLLYCLFVANLAASDPTPAAVAAHLAFPTGTANAR